MLSSNAPETNRVPRLAMTIAAYAVFALAVMLVTFLVAKAALAEKAHSTEVTQRAGTLMQLAALRQNVFETESALERYLLLGNQAYLTEYRELATVIERRVSDLKSGVGVNTRERAYFDALATHIHCRLSLMDRCIELANRPAFRQNLAQTAENAVEETQAIKAILVQLEAEQHRALARIRAEP